MNRIDVDAVNALRVLAADEVQKANSGHPGLPLGAACGIYSLGIRNEAQPQELSLGKS